MGHRYFRGRIDFGGLPLADLAKATEALAVLEQLAGDGKIGFAMGVARTRSEPRRAGRPGGRPIQPQEREMLEALRTDAWMSSRELARAMPDLQTNSLTARLATMAAAGWIEVSRRENADRPPGSRGRRSVKVYRRPTPPAGETLEDADPASPCVDVPDGRHREEEQEP